MSSLATLLAIIFLSTLGGTVWTMAVLQRHKRTLANEAEGSQDGEDGRQTPPLGSPEEELRLPFSERVIKPLLASAGQALSRYLPQRAAARINERLVAAGRTTSYNQFLATKAVAGALAFLFSFAVLLPLTSPDARSRYVLLFGLITLAAYRLPDYLLSRRLEERRHQLERQLPDAMDLLCISVEAGLGFDGAIQKVAEKFADPISSEFSAYLAEARLGRPRSEALRNLATRAGTADMRSFTGAVIQAEQLGVSISRVLRSQSESIRVRRKQRVQEMAMKVPVKMLIPMALFILPCVFIVILGPAFIKIGAVFGGIGGP
jgi:tight adherence protein C